MRPKSIATVVASFSWASGDASLIFLSVETTSISLTDCINWVLPELNGPVITILTVCIGYRLALYWINQLYIVLILSIRRLTTALLGAPSLACRPLAVLDLVCGRALGGF